MSAHPLSFSAAMSTEVFSVGPLQPLAQGAGLAHDAGNLLGALSLYSSLLAQPGVLRPEHHHYADELQLLSRKSSALIRKFLGHTGPALAGAAASSCDPVGVLRGLSPLLSSLAAPGSFQLEVPRDSSARRAAPRFLPFEAESLERITVNLVRNAADSLEQANAQRPEGPAIVVRLLRRNAMTTLEVEDNGPGMPPAIAARFLQPTPLPAGAQRGLGHRIVHELAVATGGQLEVRVRPGRGTTLRIHWRENPAAATDETPYQV